MKAAVITPQQAGTARLADVPEPLPSADEVRVRVEQVGLDGTDAEIARGEYGEAPPSSDYLIMGHESLGRVEGGALAGSGLSAGDLVVAIVRRPDPVPCMNCAAGEWDMCLNGRYTERGIKGRHGYLCEYYTERPEYLVRLPSELAEVGVLLEPLSIVEKALDQIDQIQSRLVWHPERALVLGAGPIGLLAGLLLRLRGMRLHFYERVEGGLKRQLAEQMGAEYITAREAKLGHDQADGLGPVDIVIEATGYSPLVFGAMDIVGTNGIVCLTGVSAGSRRLEISADHLNLEMVLSNKVVFGTVNANRRHYKMGVDHLTQIEARWPGLLKRLITDRLPIEEFARAFEARGDDSVKTVVRVAP